MDPDKPSADSERSAAHRPAGGNRAAAGRTRPDNARWDRAGEILAAVNGRWTFPILRHLASGESRPTDLLTAINTSITGGRLSRKVLLETLQRMNQSGMIRRQEISRRPRETHYWLTETGHEILNEISKLGGTTLGWPWMTEHLPGPVPDLHTDVAHPARIWNVWLGGKDNFAADRDAARSVAAAMPSVPAIARLARRFQADAVRQLLDRGVRQFLDIGTGLPAAGSVHEIAQREAPESRVVYADNDPLVLAHARALLTSSPEGTCDYIEADVREPGKILAHAARTLDLSQPTAVLLIAVLHFIPDSDDPWAITARLIDGIPGNTHLVIGHAASDIRPSEAAAMSRQYNQKSAFPITVRTKAQVTRLFHDLELWPPGVVAVSQWWPTPPEPIPGEDSPATPESDRGQHAGAYPGAKDITGPSEPPTGTSARLTAETAAAAATSRRPSSQQAGGAPGAGQTRFRQTQAELCLTARGGGPGAGGPGGRGAGDPSGMGAASGLVSGKSRRAASTGSCDCP